MFVLAIKKILETSDFKFVGDELSFVDIKFLTKLFFLDVSGGPDCTPEICQCYAATKVSNGHVNYMGGT